MPFAHPSAQLSGWRALFRINLHPELKELYIFTLIYSFAFALITIFEPVFFYQEGFSLSFIALYYGLHYTLYVLIMPLGGKFVARFGLEKSLTLSLPFFVAYFLVLAAIPSRPALVWLAIVLLTLHKIFYWPAFHTMFSKFGDARNRGTELSWISLLRYGVGVLGPLAGGVIALYFGFPILFILAAALVLVSAVPLLRTKERYRAGDFPYLSPWKIVFSRRFRNMSLAMMGMGENLIDMVYWPIFLFIILGSTDRLGFFTSATIAIMTIFTFLVGEMADRQSRRYVLRMHLPFMIIGYLFRPLAMVPLQAFLTDTLNKMTFAGVNLPMLYRLYIQARSTSILRYMIAFELVLAVAKAATAFALAGVFAVALPYTGFTIAFVAAAVMALMYIFL